MQIKTTLRFHLTTVRMAKVKNTDDNLRWRDCGVKGTLLALLVGVKAGTTPLDVSAAISQKIRKHLPQDPVIPLLGIYPKDAQLCHKDTCSAMFIAALFFTAITWK